MEDYGKFGAHAPEVVIVIKQLSILGLTVLMFAVSGPVRADEAEPEEVARLLREGEILPLSTILEMVRPVTGEHILEVEVEHESSGLAYEIYFLDDQGRRREVYVDARTGEIMLQKPGD